MNKRKKEIVIVELANGCHECTSHSKRNGYTRIRQNGKHQTLAKTLYEQTIGKVPDGHVIRHTCDNNWCVNVKHLITGTQQQNIQDCVERNRTSKGIKHFRCKLTEQQVKQIRSMKGQKTGKEVAKLYKLGVRTVYHIWNRTSWKHLE